MARGKPGQPGKPGESSEGAEGGVGGAGGAGGAGGIGDAGEAGGGGGAGGLGGGGGQRGEQGPPGPRGPRANEGVAYWRQTGVIPRWQLLGVYVLIVGAMFVGLTLYSRRTAEVRDAQGRSCQVVAEKIQSDIELRNVQNRTTSSSIAARRRYALVSRRLARAFRAQPSGALVLAFLNANVAVQATINEGALEMLHASDASLDRWRRLKTKLDCP